MKLPRQSRRVAALLVLMSLLFAQLAVAAYACPGMEIAQAMESIAASAAPAGHHDMAGCKATGKSAPCNGHGQVRNQSLDKPELPLVSPFIASVLVQTISPDDSIYPSVGAPPANISLMRSTAPPLSIRNCCFQI